MCVWVENGDDGEWKDERKERECVCVSECV